MHLEPRELETLIAELLDLRASLRDAENEFQPQMERVPPDSRASARNLVHYLALRRRDLRPLQQRLARLGLSSLGRAEAHVSATLDAVLAALHGLAGRDFKLDPSWSHGPTFEQGSALLRERATRLFGSSRSGGDPGRSVRILVTMPAAAAVEPQLIQNLVAAGMDCLRVNCAHDDPAAWGRMVSHLEKARQATGHPCRLLMDLGGPKLRTGAMEPGPQVTRWEPTWSDTGELECPARIWLTPEENPEPAPDTADAHLPVKGAWLESLQFGDEIRFEDLRRKHRKLLVRESEGRSRWAEATQIAYVGAETVLGLTSRNGEPGAARENDIRPRTLAPIGQYLQLQAGDILTVTRDQTPGRPLRRDAQGRLTGEATIPCTLPEVLGDVRTGERIWFDDGKIGGVVVDASADKLRVEIQGAAPPGKKLRADKGINLPDSHFTLPALTARDLQDLSFVCEHADLVGLSFVNHPEDVNALLSQIEARTHRPLGIVLKIETQRAFRELPRLLLEALRAPIAGVMIARGDLAVECGYERLAEVQEEILWLCEAAHLPAIWATQVLETLNKKGVPSRAEITDAAMGERAECVMLNKGPHVVEAVRVLDDILCRMQRHQDKKTSLLRELRLGAGAVSPAGHSAS